MKRYLLGTAIIIMLSSIAQARYYPESIFGLDVPVYRWSWQTSNDIMGLSCQSDLGEPSDAAILRFADDCDTSDIILLVDHLSWKIYWIRTNSYIYPRPLVHFGSYGTDSTDTNQFIGVCKIAVGQTGEYYDGNSDHIFLADRMNHRIVKMNFHFYSLSPESDNITWESASVVDSEYLPSDMVYLNEYPQNRVNNNLLVLDDGGKRIVTFSDEGNFLSQYNLIDPLDTIPRSYHSFACKASSDTISIYLIDSANDLIRYFRLLGGSLTYINELQISGEPQPVFTDICYLSNTGLMAIDGYNSKYYEISDNLSIISELSNTDFDSNLATHPFAVCQFPERLVLFEENEGQTSLSSYTYEPHGMGKREAPRSDILPYEFSLEQNYPNPFNPNTMIRFSLPEKAQIMLQIFDILGRQVTTIADEVLDAGYHEIIWDGKNSDGKAVASGVYFYKLSTADKSASKRMVLLK